MGCGGRMRKYPWPLISAEKLDTQNGIRNRRKVCQWLGLVSILLSTLSSKAIPTMALIPSELSQICGAGSKCLTTATRYQIR